MGPKTRSICGFFKVLSAKTAVKAPASVSSQAVFDLCESEKSRALLGKERRESAALRPSLLFWRESWMIIYLRQSSRENLQVPL